MRDDKLSLARLSYEHTNYTLWFGSKANLT